jgi:hypothetical protein
MKEFVVYYPSQVSELISYGISFGTALAIAISFNQNRSVIWAIIHGFFSWFYVIYYLLFKRTSSDL